MKGMEMGGLQAQEKNNSSQENKEKEKFLAKLKNYVEPLGHFGWPLFYDSEKDEFDFGLLNDYLDELDKKSFLPTVADYVAKENQKAGRDQISDTELEKYSTIVKHLDSLGKQINDATRKKDGAKIKEIVTATIRIVDPKSPNIFPEEISEGRLAA